VLLSMLSVLLYCARLSTITRCCICVGFDLQWEEKVEKGEKDFNRISENLKKEMIRFDRKRVKDFKANLINYLEKLLNNEEQVGGL